MGRKPNPLILEYFVRGPKLADNSNRYPHTCKQCGETFPKGRIDSLTSHITKKCPAIPEADRMRACLELHGLAVAKAAAADRSLHADKRAKPREANGDGSVPTSGPGSQSWLGLETLAEASRQVEVVRQVDGDGRHEDSPATPDDSHSLELHQHFTLDDPPVAFDGMQQDDGQRVDHSHQAPSKLTPEERIQAFLPDGDMSADASNLSVAAAATARLNPSLLDPQLAHDDMPTPETPAPQASMEMQPEPTITLREPDVDQPWGEMTYMATAPPAQPLVEMPRPTLLNRGGVRMDIGDSLNGRSRSARSKFTPARRREVQEVRKIGACIRCRILRKNCGRGDPCDTCRKVLSPRVWKTGCVRTRLYEQIDLYSAGVQVVLSQNRINMLKDELELENNGTTIQVSHFPESGKDIVFETLVANLDPRESGAADNRKHTPQTVMIDQAWEDIPDKIEKYMRLILPLFIEREPSSFMRVTLETAVRQIEAEDDELLRKALELWGLVESIDRERQWSIIEKPKPDTPEEGEPRLVQETHIANDADIYTMICMQLNAAAERKANNTSRALLSHMDRLLTDSKVKVGFRMFLTAIIFLNCVEKFTWAFKAWEQDHLRPGWPLERDPSVFTQQGGNLASLLRMLLGIRKALPQTARKEEKLVCLDQDAEVVEYFGNLNLDYATLESRQEKSQFSPVDSRSLEMTLCSQLLLPA